MIRLKTNPLMLPKVNDFFKIRSYAGDQDLSNCELTAMFDTATRDATGAKDGLFFKNIYMPLKLATANGMPELSTYVDIGLSLYELAEVYWAQYGSFYFAMPYYYCKDATEQAAALLALGRKARSVLLKNKYKYLKDLELLGLEYNPLFNVDGTEIRQHLENQGPNTATETNGNTQTFNSVKDQHNVSTYDTVAKAEYDDTRTGSISDSGSRSTTYSHDNAKNNIDGQQVDYEVNAGDTAFGYRLVGGDKMEIEKLIRQGNIGVTKTTELIESQRELIQHSIVDEYFNDLNRLILVGVYH